jgi:hypothetical protein
MDMVHNIVCIARREHYLSNCFEKYLSTSINTETTGTRIMF